MTTANIISLEGEKKGNATLPQQFSEEYRPEIIRRAFDAQASNSLQPHGTKPTAGKLFAVYVSKRRREYKSIYGHGRSRGPRKVMWKRGGQFGFQGAFAPFAVGGRQAHPPKVEKVIIEKVNKKERLLAIRSALSATTNFDLVSKKHSLDKIKSIPFIIENSFEKLKKTADVIKLIEKIGLTEELGRISQKKVRAGKGKMRGRKYTKKTGPLFVVSGKCDAVNAAKGIQGVDVVEVRNLNVGLLAPGSHAGRLAVFTEDAIEKMKKEELFL